MPRKYILASLICSIVFTVVFYKQSIGINLTIFEFVALIAIQYLRPINFRNYQMLILFAGTVVTAILVTIYNSALSIWVNLISWFIFTGALVYPQFRSLLNVLGLSFYNLFPSQIQFFRFLNDNLNGKIFFKGAGKVIKLVFIPLIIIVLFVFIYSMSNPVFQNYVVNIFDFIGRKLEFLNRINFTVVFVFILGLFISNYILIGVKNESIILNDTQSSDTMSRVRIRHDERFAMRGLLNEYKSGIFLLVVLNLLILSVNIIDINWVWFNFKWNGQYLKQFVHEGTYLLIISILISIGIILYFFRGNLNFFSKNKLLKTLSYIWMIQNVVLAISVCIRNFRYIEYYALAYKRIGVIFFLMLTIYGIYTVIIKVKTSKSAFYLFRRNLLAVYLVLVVMSLFNWDIIIAKYNLKNYDHSFVHLEFLAFLSDKALPYIDVPGEQLNRIRETQQKLFPFADKYMTNYEYMNRITQRKINFIARWEKQQFFSWNYADYKAYLKIKEKR